MGTFGPNSWDVDLISERSKSNNAQQDIKIMRDILNIATIYYTISMLFLVYRKHGILMKLLKCDCFSQKRGMSMQIQIRPHTHTAFGTLCTTETHHITIQLH